MSEVLRELVVALSLDSLVFARNLRTIGKQIKEAESTFGLAGAGIEKFEGSVKGTETKRSMLRQKLTNQKLAVEQYSRALVAANQKLVDSHARQENMLFLVMVATLHDMNRVFHDCIDQTVF